MGFGVAKPWGESDRYDFIVDAEGRLFKVQVKSAHCACYRSGIAYKINTRPRWVRPYQAHEIDLLVAFIVPLDIWYVFPPSAFETITAVHLFPQCKRKTSKYERYREAWDLFRK